MFEKAALTGKTARWLLLLSEFDITYVTQKSIKGRAIAEHLAEHPIKEEHEFKDCFPDEEIAVTEEEGRAWKLYFDGAANQNGYEVGALLIAPDESHTPIAIKLNFEGTNNTTEYEACIHGLEAALTLKIKEIKVFGDSALIICQTQGK